MYLDVDVLAWDPQVMPQEGAAEAVPGAISPSDRFSSRTIILSGGVLAAAFAFPFLALLQTGQAWAAYVAIRIGTGVLAPMMFSAQGAFLSRQFPTESRSTGVGTSREIGTAVAGGLAPLGALSMVVAAPTHSTAGVGIVLVIAGLLVFVGSLFDQGRRFSASRN